MTDFPTWFRRREHTIRRQGFGAIESDPQFLFEKDGGPEGMTADLYLARLIGPNDEIVDDTMSLPSALQHFKVPRRLNASALHGDEATIPLMPVDLYELQSSYAIMHFSPELGFEGKPVTVLFLRYRRHLDYR